MSELSEVIAAAHQLNEQKDDAALEILVGMREKIISEKPELKGTVNLDVKYDEKLMGPLDDIKRLGKRVVRRWNKELFSIVCGNKPDTAKDRETLLSSLNLGEAAVIAAVAGILISLGVGGALAAPLAPIIVRKFIWPAKDELCTAWGEALDEQ